jgi:acetylornithine deacetylase/succinyl-diaminopimelate desuccinylase-like protein
LIEQERTIRTATSREQAARSAMTPVADAATDSVDRHLDVHHEEYVAQLVEFLAIPSVSSVAAHTDDVRRGALWTADALRRAGLEHVRVIETDGHPLVYGDWLHARGAPTALVYGHYDVQPADPLEAWMSPPFAATVRDARIYARGATDDKGQLFIHIAAIAAYLAVQGRLPINVKVLIEGEEEIGSVQLTRFVENERALLAADVVIDSDNAMLARGVPSLARALRGIACFQLDVRTTERDLHSGTFGGVTVNAATAIVTLLAALKDAAGGVAIPGFYDDVRAIDDADRAELVALPFDERAWCDAMGIPVVAGESGYTTFERMWARPTLDINGIASGFAGDGFKTVLPATATAKLSMRLVPNQDPVRVGDLLEAHLAALAAKGFPPGSVRVTLDRLHAGSAWTLPRDNPFLRAAARAFAHAFEREPVFTREGGSNSIVPVFERVLGVPWIMFGIGLPDENPHAPNEHLDLDNFRRGTHAAARLYEEVRNVAIGQSP